MNKVVTCPYTTVQCACIYNIQVRVMVFNATFNNISVISWWSVLFWGKPEYMENTTDLPHHWQTLSCNVVSSTPRHERDSVNNIRDKGKQTSLFISLIKRKTKNPTLSERFQNQLVLLWAQLTKIYPPLPTSVQPISITKTLLIVSTKNERDPPLFTGKLLIQFQNILRNTTQVIIRRRVKILFSVISNPITLERQKWKSS
jgi:hypothetical protein